MRAALLGLAGAALLLPISWRFRADSPDCPAWPPLPVGILAAIGLLAAIALITWAWLDAARRPAPTIRAAIGRALPMHALALFGLPFLSRDPLFYAALGRMQARGGSANAWLDQVLPASDPFLRVLPSSWHHGNTPYWPGFNLLARAIAWIGGDSLPAQLHLYQLVGAISVLGAAAIAGRAAKSPRAAALVAFCPLALVEGTLNAHNDALLMPAAAAFALWAASRTRGVAALATGLLVKASALVALTFALAEVAFARFARRIGAMRLYALMVALGVALVVAYFEIRPYVAYLWRFSAIIGHPTDPMPHCTRSLETAPRFALHFALERPDLAFDLGIAFRAAGALWLLYAAARSAGDSDEKRAGWLATALFGYYLLFHGFMQSWYLLPLAALLPFAPAHLQPAMQAQLVSSVAYYAIGLPVACNYEPLVVVSKEFLEGITVMVPAMTLALRGQLAHRRERRAA